MRRILALALLSLVALPLPALAAKFVITLPVVDTDGRPIKNLKSCRIAILDGTTAAANELVSSDPFDVPADGKDEDGKPKTYTLTLSPASAVEASLAKAGKLVCENSDGEEGEPRIVAHSTFRAARPGPGALQIED